ncbi:diphthine--ammonia ligase [[Candida] railenensis]|uniref:Diphthine--ammonia ligase n=1 Tax=[Candida] railenensis TaxID=45579 RepID=A0A9P0QLJ4_9ASCO|nr:diphthine--ammonia ligase [[Candida] railenensis]
MKFVALISGGKDSFYNIHHCISRGHELVCLANLYPEEPERDEIDSFMFQTVGHDIINSYSECLDIPLYREKIVGSSKNQKLEYSLTKEDEIEDLFRLLQRVQRLHPDIEGVSCGAILSHYQRTRVENVCDRLGLTSLTYLWQRNQLELMGEMCQNGLDARIVKVAAIGLNTSHLGKSISQLYPKLIQLNQMYDVHICGEGGEFETLVFDAPFFKKKLEILSEEVIADSTDDVSYLKVKVKAVPKEVSVEDFQMLEAPPLLEEEFSLIFEELESIGDVGELDQGISNIDLGSNGVRISASPTSIFKTSKKLYISNLIDTELSDTIEGQVQSIFEQLKDILEKNSVSANNIKHVTLLLADMNEFSKVNKVYSRYFESFYLPPSRICIGTKLYDKCFAQLSCEVLLSDHLLKEGIHIRSRSYWAPHNIGPYSQSIVERNEEFLQASLSGQIPLEPATMQFPKDNSLNFHATFSLQHLHRVTEVVNVREYGSIICFVTEISSVNLASSAWNQYNNGAGSLTIVQVKQLPRGAKIEWGGFSYKNLVGMYDDDEDDDNELEQNDKIETIINDTIEKYSLQATSIQKIGKGELFSSTLYSNSLNDVSSFLINAKGKIQLYASLAEAQSLELKSVEFTPVDNLWDHNGQAYKYGLVWKHYK